MQVLTKIEQELQNPLPIVWRTTNEVAVRVKPHKRSNKTNKISHKKTLIAVAFVADFPSNYFLF